MNNLVVSLKKDEMFEENTVYQASWIYDSMIDIATDNGLAKVGIDDPDFVFIVNPNENLVDYLQTQYTFYQYKSQVKG